MIDEEKLIERLEKCKLEGETNAWDAMNLAISIAKDMPKVDVSIEELKAKIARLRKELDRARNDLERLEEKEKGLYELPAEPIDCAAMLINATIECENSPILKAVGGPEKSRVAYYTPDELRQIAEHLLVYCNHVESE